MRRRGIGLAEVVVSLAIMSVLMLGLVQLYGVSYRAYAIGTSKLKLQQKARIVMQRVSMDIRSAIQPGASGQPVETPALNGTGAEVIFFRPEGTFDSFDPRHPTFRKWRLVFDNDSKKLVEQKRNEADDDWDFVSTLGSSQSNEDELQAIVLDSVVFARPEPSAVRVTIKLDGQVQNASGGRSSESFTLVSDVPIPFFTLSH